MGLRKVVVEDLLVLASEVDEEWTSLAAIGVEHDLPSG